MTRPLALIVAHDAERGIGREGALAWRHQADLALFRRLTMGHVLVMGRRTVESLPPGGLPGRRIVCLTRGSAPASADRASHDLEGAFAAARELSGPDGRVFVAGGEEVYAQALPHAGEAYVSEIPGRHGCDRHFPDLEAAGWARHLPIDLPGARAFIWRRPPT
jgi:dihydrofolate reductase